MTSLEENKKKKYSLTKHGGETHAVERVLGKKRERARETEDEVEKVLINIDNYD